MSPPNHAFRPLAYNDPCDRSGWQERPEREGEAGASTNRADCQGALEEGEGQGATEKHQIAQGQEMILALLLLFVKQMKNRTMVHSVRPQSVSPASAFGSRRASSATFADPAWVHSRS